MKSITTGRLTRTEHHDLDRDGYVVRRNAFSLAEITQVIDECEHLVADLVRDRQGRRFQVGSYVFEPDVMQGTMIKWEGDSDVVHGIEPFAHLNSELNTLAHDPRFLEPMQDLVGHSDPMLFTEKLNLKRPQVGGVNPLHQDYPYWVDSADEPANVATAMLFLDAATLENGCLHVVPGSHKTGVWKGRTDGDAFAANEIDAQAYHDVQLVPLEMEPGSIVMFGSYLAHQSSPNTSDRERRAILFSYQPPGHRTMLEGFRSLTGR